MDERKIKDAVNSIKMSKEMENRLKMKSQDSKREKSYHLNFKKWGAVASVFALLLLLLTNFPVISKDGDSQLVNFTITAYAENSIGHELSEEKTIIDLSNIDRRLGLIASITEDGKTTIFYDVMFTVSGENIDSIDYKINKGIFIQDVIMNADEFYDMEWQARKRIIHAIGEPGSDEYQGIKKIGNAYTVKYNEQEQKRYSLAIPQPIEDDIIITVTVTYTDGTTEQQDIILNLDSSLLEFLIKNNIHDNK